MTCCYVSYYMCGGYCERAIFDSKESTVYLHNKKHVCFSARNARDDRQKTVCVFVFHFSLSSARLTWGCEQHTIRKNPFVRVEWRIYINIARVWIPWTILILQSTTTTTTNKSLFMSMKWNKIRLFFWSK